LYNKLKILSSSVLNFGALKIMPKGYWIAHVDVQNNEIYTKYREANALAFEKFGARFIVRGGKQIIEEGHSKPRTVVIEFDDFETAKKCYESEEYKNGKRWSSAKAYLEPAIRSGKCEIIRGLVTKIIINKKQAEGVEYLQNGEAKFVYASKEVIVAASAINSPKILLLSGIGPAEELKTNGIEVIADRPGVGKNLQDHLELYIQMMAKRPVSLYKYWNPIGKALVGLRWLLSKSGPGASNQFESAGFIRSKTGVKYPDIQYHFLPLAVRYDGRLPIKGHGFQAHVGPMRSKSRGHVALRSNDPIEAPKIQFNYMSHDSDWADFRNCIRLTREIFSQPAFKLFAKAEISPGAALQSDDELNSFIRDNVESAYHPCGTCKMGNRDDLMSVVDPETRVIGIDKLRVADSSIFPQITNGNLNAPSIMVGEKASDHILGKNLLPRSNEIPWISPNWETSQR
jgi:choline dehydrogenase